jgi:hypothetical protein
LLRELLPLSNPKMAKLLLPSIHGRIINIFEDMLQRPWDYAGKHVSRSNMLKMLNSIVVHAFQKNDLSNLQLKFLSSILFLPSERLCTGTLNYYSDLANIKSVCYLDAWARGARAIIHWVIR